MAIKFDDIFLTIPQAWKKDPELMRWATNVSRLSLRTGGGAVDLVEQNIGIIAEIQADISELETRITALEARVTTLENKQVRVTFR